MPIPENARHYVKWLSRLRKELHPSGRASELALYLSKTAGGQFVDWQRQIRDILDGTQKADTALIEAIDHWRVS